ncbi:phosphatase PAP2 family protein [Psychrosphaera aestuarii]|uniref:phosphatase PAP2 family protein n=1 Tax=Psychrosphaera aestuarii TaxID=1266052 RepID=UPI001B33E800|nr:phosphatase PAP2 family protein [Psychrosphaera aestuarii]
MSGLIKDNKLQQLDTQLFYQLNRNSKSSIIKLSKWLSKSGDGYLYLVISIATVLLQEYDTRFFKTALLAFAIELPVYLILKNIVKRHRPFDKLASYQSHIAPSDKFSMPSGHSGAAFLFATIVSFYYPELIMLAYTWATGIALSRVLLGVHFPSDTVIGALLGIACAEVAINAFLLL